MAPAHEVAHHRNHSSNPLLNKRGYLLAELNDETGAVKHANPTKIFKIEVGSEVRFRLKRGGPLTIDAHLIINKPRSNHYNLFGGFSSVEEELNGATTA